MTTPKFKWVLDEGVHFCRELNAAVAPAGFFVGLAGGVLMRGYSSKDLDVLVVPMTSAKVDLGALRLALARFEMKLRFDHLYVQRQWRKRQVDNQDAKHVEVWDAPPRYGRRRVDLIIVK